VAVSGLVLIVAPTVLVVVGFMALAESASAGFAHTTGVALATMLCPVRGATITQGFGPTSAVFEPPGFGYPHFHTGIDLAAPTGTPVQAAKGGLVVFAGTQIDALGIPVGFGNYLKVAAGAGDEEIYAHLASVYARPNQLIKAGEVIGAVGSTGSSTGPHLHFEMRVKGTPLDPSSALEC
jgi:murein DD-endopeptidase MepM/ murein hydrolase activator NlpD